MNRAQQAYFVEKSSFTISIDELGIGINQQTNNYEYVSNVDPSGTIVTNNGRSLTGTLKSYVGVTYLNLVTIAGTQETLTITILCESPAIGIGTLQTQTSTICPTDWILLPI